MMELQENMANAGLLDDNNSEITESEVKRKSKVGSAIKGAGKKMFGIFKKLGKKKKKDKIEEVEDEDDKDDEADTFDQLE